MRRQTLGPPRDSPCYENDSAVSSIVPLLPTNVARSTFEPSRTFSRTSYPTPVVGHPVNGTWASHGHPSRRIEASTGLVLDDRTQGRTERLRRDHLESKSRIERHVPRDVSERERDRVVARSDRPSADGSDEFRPEAAAPMLGMNIDFLEMS